MVVDDNPTNNLLCKFVIRKVKEDSELHIFPNPEDALAYIKENNVIKDEDNVTLLFLDINMPFMTGWEFLEEYKNFDKGIHKQFIIYMLSSSIDKRDQEKAEINPFVSGFISKPLSTIAIIQILKDHNLMG